MAQFTHFDEARSAAIVAVREWVAQEGNTADALLIADLFGQLRVVVFPSGDVVALSAKLAEVCGTWWRGDVVAASSLDEATHKVFINAWHGARVDVDQPRLRLADRHRSRTAWFAKPVEPPWVAPEDGPPIVVFYSFKGGLGRSTLLAGFAVQRARAGERVCVIDLDLDSPGAGRLLSADQEGHTASWGVVDFFLEHHIPELRFEEYWHRCDRVAGSGEIRVMPAGLIDENYPDKLGRIDLEEAPSAHQSALWKLLERTRNELKPDWILLDARTGISEPAGHLLSGIAHLHVLLGSMQEQSWQGLDMVLDRLGRDRVLGNQPQAEVLLAQAMVPVGEPGKWAKETFSGRAENTFEERYYAEALDEADADRLWTVNDMDSQDAPHVSWPIDYDPRLASFADIAEVAEALCAGAHAEIGTRIGNRFVKESST